MKVVLAGGSGALGRRIADDLTARGDEIVVLTRAPRRGAAHREVAWDGVTVGAWAEELAGAVVVNLAGALVDRRPTPAAIELLTSSRVQPTRALAAAAATGVQPSVWLQSSTLAIYGDGGDAILDETAPLASGPPQMAGVARAVGGRRALRCPPTAWSRCAPASSWRATLPRSIGSRRSRGAASAGASRPAGSGSAGCTSPTS